MVKKARKTITQFKENAANESKNQNKSKNGKLGFFGRIFNYFKEMKSELKKVVWPTKKNLFNGIFTVLIMVLIVATIVVTADFIFHNLLKLLLGTK